MTSYYQSLLLLALVLSTGCSQAHMEMTYPPPLKSKYNPNAGGGNVDYSMTSPLKADGTDFPCKGYLSLLGSSQGRSVAAWTAAGSYNFSVSGGAAHGGGSCQASLSTDRGRTFRVIHSYQGACPAAQGTSSFGFALPADVPATKGAVFAWTWFNNLGNREMYMNCAVVDVAAAAAATAAASDKLAFGSRPVVFEANIGNGCRTVDSANVKFPDPGPDVDYEGSTVPPTGSCGAAAASSGGGGGGSSPGSGSGPGSGSRGGGSGSGASTGASSTGSSGENAGAGSPTTLASPYSPTCRPALYGALPPDPRPATPAESGWTPGNDWPAGFQSGAARASGQVYPVAALSVIALMRHLR